VYELTPRELASKSAVELAAWHAAQPPGSVQFILAQREWRRRSVHRAAAPAGRLSATVAIAAVLLGVVVGYMLSTSNALPDLRSSQSQSQAAEYRALLRPAAPIDTLELKLDRGIYKPTSDGPLESRPAVLM